MQRRKTPEEIKIIDCFIKMYYPEHGADYCASELQVAISYVRYRANIKGVTMIQPVPKKYETKLEEIERLKKNNAELRTENIKLIVENKKLKGGNNDSN